MFTVDWSFKRLTKSDFSGYRVKRQENLGKTPAQFIPMPSHEVSTSFPGSVMMQSAPQKKIFDNDPDNYLFAFWSYTAQGTRGEPAFSGVSFSPYLDGVSISFGSANYVVSATAWYIYDFRNGIGNGGRKMILLDAFDTSIGDFIADDFVDVYDSAVAGLDLSLTQFGNNGDIDSDMAINNNELVTIHARSSLPGYGATPDKLFDRWQQVASLTSHDTNNGETAPAIVGQDLMVGHDDIVVALGIYYNDPAYVRLPVVVPHDRAPLHWILTDTGWMLGSGGNGGDDPTKRILGELYTAYRLAEAAYFTGGKLQSMLLDGALDRANGFTKNAQTEEFAAFAE